ncbi:MAG: hypothetical protein OXU23_12390 [Candidatus Poribacteria bacterium]|nr:hypothetical protein [Candidatus Poribacteria bacterium]
MEFYKAASRLYDGTSRAAHWDGKKRTWSLLQAVSISIHSLQAIFLQRARC